MAWLRAGSSRMSAGTALAIRGRDGPASLLTPVPAPPAAAAAAAACSTTTEALARILCVRLHAASDPS